MPAAAERTKLTQTLGRVAMLLTGALALWGALLFASTLANALGEGTTAAFARLVPERGASFWSWLAPLSVALALAAALAAAALAIRVRTLAARERGASGQAEGS